MAKYNITELKEKKAEYRTMLSPETLDALGQKILKIVVMDKKYLDSSYSATKLAQELGTNTRYISAVMGVKFHQNYTSFVNFYRIQEAMSLLTDKRYLNKNIAEIGKMVGFSNRQSFYGAFFRFRHETPRDYRLNYLERHPDLTDGPKKRGRKPKTAK